MLTQAILLLAVCIVAMVFAAVDDVSPKEVAAWVVVTIVALGVMYACPDLGMWP